MQPKSRPQRCPLLGEEVRQEPYREACKSDRQGAGEADRLRIFIPGLHEVHAVEQGEHRVPYTCEDDRRTYYPVNVDNARILQVPSSIRCF
ncbi:MAG: hypothetical protein ACUVTL_01265 [Thermoproteota archaeon]